MEGSDEFGRIFMELAGGLILANSTAVSARRDQTNLGQKWGAVPRPLPLPFPPTSRMPYWYLREVLHHP